MKKFTDFSFRDPENISSLNQLREQLLHTMLLVTLVVGAILLVLAVIPAWQNGLYLSILVYTAVYGLVLVLTFSKKIPFQTRRLCWLFAFFTLGVINLVMNGFNVDAGLFFLGFIAMAALLGGLRNGLIALGITFLALSISGFVITTRNISLSMGLPQTDPMLWIIGGTILLLVGMFLIVSLNSVIRGLDRNLLRAKTLAQDLTIANETLQRREERFRSLIDGSTDIISVVSRDGTIQYVNAQVENILGYKAEELIGQNIFHFLHPDDLQASIAALSPGTPPESIGPYLEVRAHRKDGSWRVLQVSGSEEMLHNPAVNGTIVTCRDVTESKAIEEDLHKSQFLLQKTFSSLSDALFLIDSKTMRILDCNEAVTKLFGYDKNEVIGQTPGILFRDASTFDEFSQLLHPEIEAPQLLERFESWMRRRNGLIFPTECSLAPLIDAEAGHLGWVCLIHDISVRKRAEQLLMQAKDELEQKVAERTVEVQRTSKQLQELLAHSPAVIYSASPDGDFGLTFVSENVTSLTGYEVNRFKWDIYFWRNLIHTEDLPRILEGIKGVRQSGGGVLEYRISTSSGETRWVHDEMKLVEDEDGEAKEFVGSWVDITDQKVAERALRESEEINRIIINSTSAIISLVDPNGIVIAFNEAGTALLGKKPKDLIGRCIFDYFPPEVAKIRKAWLEKAYRTGKPVHFEDCRDGYWFDNSFFPVVDEQGKITRLVIYAFNITENKKIQESLIQSEARYRTLADASPDMIFIIDREDKVQYVNTFASKFLRLPVEEIIGQPRSLFFAGSTNDHQKMHIFKVLDNGESTYAEDETRTPDRSIWLGTWLVPLRETDGTVSGVLGVSRDITMQKQAEMEILQSRKQLEERVKERTAELIASENQLRQLTSQLVSAQEEERRRISRELHDEAGQAIISLKYNLASMMINISDRLMTQIRTMARSLRPPVLEIGGINLSLKVFCEEMTERTGLPIAYQGVEIPDLPDEIGISLYRFVQEALTNTLKHARATQVTIKLQYRKKVIALSVVDNGHGVEGNIPSDGIGLLGLGERFNLFGGSIRLTSKKGRGTRVIASLPWPRPVEEQGK